MDNKSRHKILAINANRKNLELLEQFLEREKFKVEGVATLEELDRFLATDDHVDLALFYVTGFDESVWPRCERMRKLDIPVLIISPRQSDAVQREGVARGASSVLIKPLVVRELLGLIDGLLAGRDKPEQ